MNIYNAVLAATWLGLIGGCNNSAAAACEGAACECPSVCPCDNGVCQPDADGDGISDADEGANEQPPRDSDADGTPDFEDSDSDDDGLADVDEGTGDWDGDGVGNAIDPHNNGAVPSLLLTSISTEFNQPVGIDYHALTNSVVISVNYPTGTPRAFERIEADGDHEAFSTFSGLTDEVKIATARAGSEFAAGTLFVGNGVDGQVARIAADGGSFENPWVTLPNGPNGLMRGSLYVDRTGVWSGDLLLVTSTGKFWRVTAAGQPTLVAEVGVHLEGMIAVPNKPVRYGPLAGKVIAGAEAAGLLYVFSPDGSHTTLDLDVAIEDIDFVEPNENFFGINYGTSKLLGAPASELLPIAGDILLNTEYPVDGQSGLYWLRWNGEELLNSQLGIAPGSALVDQWEHMTTAPAGVVEIPPIS